MSSDEETFVIIVGDDDYEIPDSVKDVVENSEITHLTSLDEIETENVEIKEEPEDYFFKEEPVDDLDEEYVPKSETSSDDDYSDDDINNVNRSRRKKVKVITSYVQELREAYPELRNDRKMLINILSQIMKAMKPPPLPRDYFIMNGIMLECIECGKLSNGILAAGRHYQEYHGERYLICFACGVDFRSPTNLYKHEKRCPAPDIGIVLKARARHIGNKARARPFLSYEKPKERTDDAEEVRVYGVREALRAEVGAAPARAPRPPPPAAAMRLPAVPAEISPNVITQTAYEEGAWLVTYD